MTTLIAYALIQFSILTSGPDSSRNTLEPTQTQAATCRTYGGTGGWDNKD